MIYKFSVQEWLRDIIVSAAIEHAPTLRWQGVRAYKFIKANAMKGDRK